MNGLEASLRHVVGALRDLGQRFALVGGFAVSVRTEPRLTRDADIAVAVDGDRQAEQLIHRLGKRDYRPIATVEHETSGRLATVRLSHLGVSDLLTDLLFASSGIEVEIVAAAEELVVVPGLVLPVATVGHLVAMKLLVRDDRRRPTDSADIDALGRVATGTDWEQAQRAVELISERGFDRGRDLDRALQSIRPPARPDPGDSTIG